MPSPIAAWLGAHGVKALPGYSLFLLPWIGTKSATGFTNRAQSSSYFSGGELLSSSLQNDEFTEDLWLDTGTYKIAHIYRKGTDMGIHSLQLNAVEKGTVDAYNAAASSNNYTEVTGVVLTAGLYTFKVKMATKNASSTAYYGAVNSSAWIRTGA